MTIKTDMKAKHFLKSRMKVDTSVRTFLETCNSLAPVIFDTKNLKRVNQFVSRDIKMLLILINRCYVVLGIFLLSCIP